MTKKKALVIKISVGLVVFLLVCTIISRNVYNMLLPVVSTVESSMGTLDESIDINATLGFSNQKKLVAKAEWLVNDVLAQTGDTVKKGDPLFTIDTSRAGLDVKRAELSLLRLQNSLTENELNSAQKAELQLQLDMAQQEYKKFKEGKAINEDMKELLFKIDIAMLENQAVVDEQALALANEEYYRYRQTGSGYDKAEANKLRGQISIIQKKLLADNLSSNDKTALEADLKTHQDALAALQAASPEYDPLKEERLRVAAEQAEQKLKDNKGLPGELSILELQKIIAQDEYNLYRIQQGDTLELEGKKLELAILQLENRINGDTKTAAAKKELQAEVEIAKTELANVMAACPDDGVIRAEADGTVEELFASVGQALPVGATAVALTTDKSLPCVYFNMSPEAEKTYRDVKSVNVLMQGGEASLVSRTANTVDITAKKQNPQTGAWELSATLPPDADMPEVVASVRVRITKSGGRYDTIIPVSCLRTEPSGGYSVMMLETRKGIFSEESYASSVLVDVEEKNNLYAAVKSDRIYYGTKVIEHSTKPLSNGSVVSLEE